MEQSIGRVLRDRYQIQSLLGRKTGRRTFLAQDLDAHTIVVVKLILFGPDFSWDDLKLFEREAKTLQELTLASIPRYLDSFEVETEWGRGFALVQSHIDAKSLQDWANAGRSFSEAELQGIAMALLEILDSLHTRHPPVIHRDIKPSNILLGDRSGNSLGNVYLVDFGSVQVARGGDTITVVGSYGYMAPEQFFGKSVPATDLYGLGATLIYLLAGVHPADLPIRNGRIRFEGACSASDRFQSWLRYLIQPDANQRFQSALSALDALRDDRIVTPMGSSSSKPNGSRVVLVKTEDRLKISIPAASLGQQISIAHSILWGTAFAFSPLLLYFLRPKAVMFVVPLVLFLVGSTWARNIYKLFAKTQLSIAQEKACLTVDWLGLKRRFSFPTKEISRIERRTLGFSHGTSIQYSALYLWAGNRAHAIGSLNPTGSELSQLTEVELDWLADELSDWLDLPVRRYGGISAASEDSSPTAVAATKSSSEKASTGSAFARPVPANETTQIYRPPNSFCTVSKRAGQIEISAPAVNGCSLQALAVGLFVFFFMFLTVAPFGLVGAFIGAVPVIIWLLGSSRENRAPIADILLRIDRCDASSFRKSQSFYNVSLWRKSQTDKLVCLDKADCRQVQKLQLFYKAASDGKQSCHVRITTDASTRASKGYFLIGNRTFWLSRPEAVWLAGELSAWLKLPISEVEVVESAAA